MGSDILYRSVHIGPRQEKEPGSIVSVGTVKVTVTEPYYIRAVPALRRHFTHTSDKDTTVYIG